MAGKSPEQAPREETPTTGGSRGADRGSGRTQLDPADPRDLATPHAPARRPSARPRHGDPRSRPPTPLPTVYVGDTLLVRDVHDPDLDADGRPTRVDELVDLAARLPDPFVVDAGRGAGLRCLPAARSPRTSGRTPTSP